MNKVVGLLILCVVCAILKAAAVALVLALILAMVWSFLSRPRETTVFLATCALSCAVVAQPLACIAGLTIVAIVLGLAGRRRKPLPTLQLGRHQ